MKIKDIDPDLKKLFQYCKIPKRTQRAIAVVGLDPHSLKENVRLFKKDPRTYKYLSPLSYMYRFSYDVTDRHTLYHYLPSKDLKSIIDSQTFLVGEQINMNDPEEGKYTWDLALERLKKLKAAPKVISAFNKLKSMTVYSHIFIWSFTRNGAASGMEKYGDVAFGVDSMKIDLDLKKRMVNDYPFSYCVVKVCYTRQVQNEYINGLMRIFKQAVEDNNVVLEVYIYTVLAFYSVVFKNPILSDEKEIRYIILEFKTTDQIKSNFIYETLNRKLKFMAPITPQNLKVIIVNHMMRFYSEYDTIADEINDMKNFLKKRGFNNTKVKKTKRPY